MLVCAVLATSAGAASPVDVYQFESAQQQARYKALIEEFRCPKCLNTNIAGSDAPIAQDLRRTVHRLVVTEGLSDDEVRRFLQQRYGDFVLYDPPFTARTWLIWTIPVALAVTMILVLYALAARARRRRTAPLSDSEHLRLQTILQEPMREE
jgi:cytochrome c-type biogenesis protein CcmH